jgi:hypothetical protein
LVLGSSGMMLPYGVDLRRHSPASNTKLDWPIQR